MAIRIQTEKPVIPIELGDLKFEFDVSDESVKKFREDATKVQKELTNITVEDEDKALELTKDVLKRGYDLILGEGAFEKVYNLSPSVLITMKYLEQIVEGIAAELKALGFEQSSQEKAKKYLAKKK